MTARTLRANIWRGILSASDQEIRDGMDFYPGAHGLCRMFARIFSVSVPCVAGIYAALSPMNGWDTNVANVLSVLRHGHDFASSVNTSHMNHMKALAILHGADPAQCLGQSKVLAFYRGIADPTDLTPIPVDRHLICLAIGKKITNNNELRAYAGNRRLLADIHAAYTYLGAREGIGNRLASIAWFVQRRVRTNQIPVLQPSRVVCCNRPMNSHGAGYLHCPSCGHSVSRKNLSLGLPKKARKTPHSHVDGFPVHVEKRGRKRIYLGVGHALANSGGWQYLSRYVVAKELARESQESAREGDPENALVPLRSDEHVHHVNLSRSHDPLDGSNYRLINPAYHGRLHASAITLAGYRDDLGRFVSQTGSVGQGEHIQGNGETSIGADPRFDPSMSPYSYPRFRAILGPAATEAARQT